MTDLFSSNNKIISENPDLCSAKDIEVLEDLELIRQRPSMYIGSTDESAIHPLVQKS